MATDRPLPPFLPESLAQYEEHASLNPEAWYQYFQAAYQFIDQRDTGQEQYKVAATLLGESGLLPK